MHKRHTTQVIHVSSVCDINFQRLREEGIDCMLFDIEGTIAAWGTADVPEEILQCIDRSGISKRGIVTNLNKKYANRARAVAERIEAGSCQYPIDTTYRKPRSRMLDISMETLDAAPENTIMSGDKFLDMLAAKNAGVRYMFWVDKLGGPDQWFDRYLYRKVEPLLKKIFAEKYEK